MHIVEERFSVVMVPMMALFLFLLLSLLVTDVATRRTFPRGVLSSEDVPGMMD